MTLIPTYVIIQHCYLLKIALQDNIIATYVIIQRCCLLKMTHHDYISCTLCHSTTLLSAEENILWQKWLLLMPSYEDVYLKTESYSFNICIFLVHHGVIFWCLFVWLPCVSCFTGTLCYSVSGFKICITCSSCCQLWLCRLHNMLHLRYISLSV